MKRALEPARRRCMTRSRRNLCFDWGFIEDNARRSTRRSRRAHHVTTLELVNNRLVANPMEPRVRDRRVRRRRRQHTLYTTSQNPHVIRLLMGAFVLGIPDTS